jgi:hypothetical protein
LLFTISNEQTSDAETYHLLAKEVAEKNEFYPHEQNKYDAYIWPSLYINLLGILYKVFLISPLIGKQLNIFLTLIIFITLKKIIALLFEENVEQFNFIYFFYPNIYFMNLLTLTEPLFLTFIIFAHLFFIIIVKKNAKYIFFISCAVCLALSILTRPVALLVPIFFSFYFIYKKINIKYILVFIIALLCVIILYGIPTKLKLGSFNALGTTGGVNLLLGNNLYSSGKYNSEVENYIDSLQVSNQDVFTKDRYYRRQAIQYVLKNPLKSIKIFPMKIFYLFVYDGKQIEDAFNKSNTVKKISLNEVLNKLRKGLVTWIILINQLIYLMLVSLIVLGIICLFKYRQIDNLILCLIVPIALFLLAIIALGSSRYHYPILIAAMPLSVYGYFFIKVAKNRDSTKYRFLRR